MGEAWLEKVFLVLFRYSSVFSRKSSLDVGEVFALGWKVGFWFANWNMYSMQLLLSNFFYIWCTTDLNLLELRLHHIPLKT